MTATLFPPIPDGFVGIGAGVLIILSVQLLVFIFRNFSFASFIFGRKCPFCKTHGHVSFSNSGDFFCRFCFRFFKRGD